MTHRICPTCFCNVRFPRERRNAQHFVIEQCVDVVHDEHVKGRPGDNARFLAQAVKAFKKAHATRFDSRKSELYA